MDQQHATPDHDSSDHRPELVTFVGGPVDGVTTLVDRCPRHNAMPDLGISDARDLFGRTPIYTWATDDQRYHFVQYLTPEELSAWTNDAPDA